MRLIIVSKSAYSHVVGDRRVPAVIAGHTSQLARSLIEHSLQRGHRVAYVYPLEPGPDDATVCDPHDSLPAGVDAFPFQEERLPKTSVATGWLGFVAAVRAAVRRLEGADWALLLYAFPLAPLLVSEARRHRFKVGVLLRGGDAYKWLSNEWWTQIASHPAPEEMRRAYVDAVAEADYVAAASQWLADVALAHGIRCDAVLESPAIRGTASGPNAKRAAAGEPAVTPVVGRLDTSRRWIVSASRASFDKRLDLALRLYEEAGLSKWQLVLAAPGPQQRAIERLASELGPGAACVVTASPRVMPLLYRAADAYLHTSVPSSRFIDARPASVTSAAFHGIPVVAPVACEGGWTESVSSLNVRIYGFDAPYGSQESRELVVAGSAALGRLRSAPLRRMVGLANARHARRSAPSTVFDRLFAELTGNQDR